MRDGQKSRRTMISSRDLANAAANEYSKDLRDYLSRRVGNPQDVEDLAQATVEKVLNIDSTAPFIRKPFGFLRTLANRVLAEAGARRAREREHMVWLYDLRPLIEGDDGASGGQCPSEDPEDREHFAGLLKKAEIGLAELSPTLAAPLILVARDGLTYAAAAERLDMTEAAVKKNIQRARARLRARVFPGEGQ